MNIWQEFHGPNAGYVAELYDRYRKDPQSVDPSLRRLFERWTPPEPSADGQVLARPDIAYSKIHAAVDLLHAIRAVGHLDARLDPLGGDPPGDPGLRPETYGLSAEELRQMPADLVGWPVAAGAANVLQVVEALRRIYASTIGYDYEHIHDHDERAWLRNAAESGRFRPAPTPELLQALLERLTRVETFERFLHRLFPGKTRFSIEGLDVMLPILDEILAAAGDAGRRTVLLGMAHRGRLNVLAHILGMPYAQILAEFKDPLHTRTQRISDDLGWTGDVKYHTGAEHELDGERDGQIVVTMAPNPSHLEHVNPAVLGMARAAGTDAAQAGPPIFNPKISLPLLIHGDAAFIGQGIVAETLNMSHLAGYTAGGTIHLIANNQLGFTTTPGEARSTLYASDLAKGFGIPIVHVNADDPIACLEAARLAFAYIDRFEKDFLIDLIGYRRYGHNEGDEPRFTQPVLYEKIEAHPSVREQLAARLVEEGIVADSWPQQRVQAVLDELQAEWEQLEPVEDLARPNLEPPPAGAANRVDTAIPLEDLRRLNDALLDLPDGFSANPKLARSMERRHNALDDPEQATIDWATAEDLALASILTEGTPIRFTGEDVERGTFSHRHAVFFDIETGEEYIPLQRIPQAQAAFAIINSPLTENATVGFEYGYDVEATGHLTIWEAQYGDFINAAQVIIDEFIVSGRAKWGQTPALVMLLPHGYEGQGPDHSTGRLERFLQMSARTNMRVANPTTAAQYFHLLRRQARLLREDPLPLIVMTPKSLLRHRQSASTPRQLAEGRWQPLIDDDAVDPEQVRRVNLCSGKIYVDLVTSDYRQKHPEVALVRIEQLYRFPAEPLAEALARYPALEEVNWVQEEPRNMGAWDFVRYHIEKSIAGRWTLGYIGRPRRASPAEGSTSWHNVNQQAIVERAFEGGPM